MKPASVNMAVIVTVSVLLWLRMSENVTDLASHFLGEEKDFVVGKFCY